MKKHVGRFVYGFAFVFGATVIVLFAFWLMYKWRTYILSLGLPTFQTNALFMAPFAVPLGCAFFYFMGYAIEGPFTNENEKER